MQSTPRLFWLFRWLTVLLCFVGASEMVRAQTGTQQLTGIVGASPDPTPFESDFTLRATLTTPPGGPAPSGTMVFIIDGVIVAGAVPVTGPDVSTPMSGTSTKYSIGTHTILAGYSGDANYAPFNLPPGTLTIRKLHSDMTLAVTTPTIFYGQTLDAYSQVGGLEAAPDATLNGGTISFYVDGIDICDLLVTGQAESCPATAGQGFNAGAHTLIATYSGNQYYDSSTSPTGNFTVYPDDTNMSLNTSGSPSVYRQSVTFTSTVAALYAIPVGPVTFLDGSTPIGTVSLDANGVATVSTSTLTVGTHIITTMYAGNQNFNAAGNATVTQIVTLPPPVPNPTVTLLSSSINPSVVGQSVTFTASVASTGAFVAIPTGSVTFLDGSATLATVTLDANGIARYTTSALTLGQHAIGASYAGATGFSASLSTPLVQTVTASLTSAGTGFLLQVTPTTITVGAGNTVSLGVTVLILNGFDQAVQLSCTSVPAETGCLFDIPVVPVGGGTARLLVSPAAPHNCGSSVPYFVASGRNTAVPMLAAALVMVFARRRKTLKGIALALLLCVLPALSGCGTGNCTDLGVKPGSYTFTVQGTSTGSPTVTQSVTVQMNVHI